MVGTKQLEQDARGILVKLSSMPRTTTGNRAVQFDDLINKHKTTYIVILKRLAYDGMTPRVLFDINQVGQLLINHINAHISLIWALKDRSTRIQGLIDVLNMVIDMETCFNATVKSLETCSLRPLLTSPLMCRIRTYLSSFTYTDVRRELDTHFSLYQDELVTSPGGCLTWGNVVPPNDGALYTILTRIGIDPVCSNTANPVLTALVYDATLSSLLDSVLRCLAERGVDEGGVHKLYALLLKLHDTLKAFKLKNGMGKIVTDAAVWMRAEAALRCLHEGKTRSKGGGSGVSSSGVSQEEAERWRALYRRVGWRWGRGRGRDARVFVLMSFDLSVL